MLKMREKERGRKGEKERGRGRERKRGREREGGERVNKRESYS
jgi:hypothetical protein